MTTSNITYDLRILSVLLEFPALLQSSFLSHFLPFAHAFLGKQKVSLCAFLEQRAHSGSVAERIVLLEQAASIAEENLGEYSRAVALWQRQLELSETPSREAHVALARLHESMGDVDGVAAALEAQLQSLEGLRKVTIPSERVVKRCRAIAILREKSMHRSSSKGLRGEEK